MFGSEFNRLNNSIVLLREIPSRSVGPIKRITWSTAGSSAYRCANAKCAPVNGLNPPGKSIVVLVVCI